MQESGEEQEAGAELAAIVGDYERRLPAKVREIGEALADARARPGDALAWAAARTLAHKLHGSAGSYGFAALGRAVARLEEALVRLGEGAAAWPEIDEAFAAAREAIAPLEP